MRKLHPDVLVAVVIAVGGISVSCPASATAAEFPPKRECCESTAPETYAAINLADGSITARFPDAWGAAAVESTRGAAEVARWLEHHERGAEMIAQRLRRLFRLDGGALYLQISESEEPFNVVLAPSETSRAVLPFENGGSLVSEKMMPSAPGKLPVAVFWFEGGEQETYRVRIPAAIMNVTIVADGRPVATAHDVGPADLPTTFHVE